MPSKVRVPFLVRDRQYLRNDKKPGPSVDVLQATPLGHFTILGEEPYFDGPVSRRVAVLDIDRDAGRLRPAVRFLPRGGGRTVGTYDLGKPELDADSPIEAFESDAFIQVNAFATVMRTLHFFERQDMLGRRVAWAFDSPQLLVVPRAGEMENAFYERESASLQFFSYRDAAGGVLHTVLSHDIVAHETTHAVLDAVAPDLYHAITPQSLALHEAVADWTAIAFNLTNEMLIFSIYNITSTVVKVDAVLSHVAEELGATIRKQVGADYLRAANNGRTLDPLDRTVDALRHPNLVDRTNPHALSEVLSGAIYQVFLRRAGMRREAGAPPLSERTSDLGSSPEEKRVLTAATSVTRMVVHALDCLPPGEASLADFGRAMLAAHRSDQVMARAERKWLTEELVRRRVVDAASELDVGAETDSRALDGVDFEPLLADEKAARAFANRHRDLLRIPRDADFMVYPRHERTVAASARKGATGARELIFRVGWDIEEEHDLGATFGTRWTVRVGTTMVADWDRRRIHSILTTDQRPSQRADRGRLLRRWANEGLLVPAARALGPDGQERADAIVVRPGGRAQQVTGGARALHVVGDAR